jgi:hypothetical protein
MDYEQVEPDLQDFDQLDQNTLEPDDDELDEEAIEDAGPSYGTGVHDQPQFSVSGLTLEDRLKGFNAADPDLTGGDIDANWEDANAVGDEAVGGTAPTPDMDIVDELGKAVGLEMDDRAFLRTDELLEQRDDRRWELDPESSEDYESHAE